MFMVLKRPRLDGLLPRTAVSEDTVVKFKAIAAKEKVTVSELQRAAYALFLQNYDSKAINDCNETEHEERKGESA